MSDHDTNDKTPTGRVDPREPQRAATAARRRPATWMVIACGAGIVMILSLVAFVWPRHATAPHDMEPASGSAAEPGAAEAPPPEASAAFFAENDGRCCPPVSGAGIARSAAADAAYDAGDFAGARDRYLDLLLQGGDFGENADAILGWAHGRLALSLAHCAHESAPSLLDEPPLSFRKAGR